MNARESGVLLVRQEGATAVLTLNRPEARNALNEALLRQLRTAAAAAAADDTVRAVVITGAGDRAFCAGADIRGMREMSAPDARRWAELGHDVFRAVESLSKPTVAAINATAVGGGCELALACDFRVMAETAQLGQPEINLGLIPGWGGTQRLPRLVGTALAKEMVLTGRPISAAAADRAGLLNRVVAADRVLPEALELAARFATLPPLAVAYAKQAINMGREMDLSAALALEVNLFAHAFATADRREGLTAFLEKRPARFEGR
ncbi:MAG TPA: enoyl-CoA hydratase-related protein [Chloroflexota bacterium]|nr:enoyl-CoA hydratase-related protein [Chloroflexota bacterium]